MKTINFIKKDRMNGKTFVTEKDGGKGFTFTFFAVRQV